MSLDITFDPILFQIGTFQLGWHGIFTALAVVVAVGMALRRATLRGFSEESVTTVVTWAIVGGIIGARLFHVLDHLSYYLDNPLQALAVWEGGIAVYGSFIGGIIGGLLGTYQVGLPRWPLLDIAAPAMLIGQAIGRLGCLSNGDAWGAPTNSSFGLVYRHPNDLLPPNLIGVPTHPYPVYEILADLILVAGLLVLRRRWADQEGRLFLVAAIGYAVIRFGLTFFREEAVLFLGLQEAQVVALVTGLIAAGLLYWRAQQKSVSGVAAAWADGQPGSSGSR